MAFAQILWRFWVEGNVVIIINERDLVVVDASGAPLSARNVITEIRKLTKKPVSYLINTHGHGDHTIGNQEYRKAFPNIETVGHEKTAEYIAGSGFNYVDDIAKSTESRKRFGEDRTRAVDVRIKSRISDDACSKGDVSTGLSFL
ncbi:MAG: MBL fold metallo-hydrolase [Acidobacteriota bacterium]